MSRFNHNERVQIISPSSSYHLKYATVGETHPASVFLTVDGFDRPLKFWDNELIPAPNAPVPVKELARTQKYLRELEEDAKLMLDASDLLPNGSGVQKDLQDFAGRQTKIVQLLKQCLKQDGVKLWENEEKGNVNG